jgi:hypothetical protein
MLFVVGKEGGMLGLIFRKAQNPAKLEREIRMSLAVHVLNTLHCFRARPPAHPIVAARPLV